MTAFARARLSTASIALLAAIAVAGCQSARLEDLAPLPGVRNTGTTPNLNVPQKAETSQFSDADKNAKIAELAAARSGQAAADPSPGARATAAQLRKAAQAQAETLKEIEGE